jgi:hypothetical protein
VNATGLAFRGPVAGRAWPCSLWCGAVRSSLTGVTAAGAELSKQAAYPQPERDAVTASHRPLWSAGHLPLVEDQRHERRYSEVGWEIAAVPDTVDPRVNRWAADHDMDVDGPPAQRADGECSFDAMLRSLAAHTDRATVRTTAKFIEYPTDHLQLAGAAWPWRDWPLGALTLAAAAGVGLLPLASHAVTR